MRYTLEYGRSTEEDYGGGGEPKGKRAQLGTLWKTKIPKWRITESRLDRTKEWSRSPCCRH